MKSEDLGLYEELKQWTALQGSGALRVLFTLFEKHRDYCVKEALAQIKKGDFHNAVRYEAKAEDQTKIMNIIQNRIKEVKKEKEEKKNG